MVETLIHVTFTWHRHAARHNCIAHNRVDCRENSVLLLSTPTMALNGSNLAASTSYSSPILDVLDPSPNGFDDPPIELLEAELPSVDHDQVPLSGLVSRVVQACYAEMTEMAET